MAIFFVDAHDSHVRKKTLHIRLHVRLESQNKHDCTGLNTLPLSRIVRIHAYPASKWIPDVVDHADITDFQSIRH
mgnify:CR=1 FL=1